MQENHEWIPNTLFDMAAFCEKNGLEKASNILTDTAVMLHICLTYPEANRASGLGDAQIVTDQNTGKSVVVFPQRPRRVGT